MMKNGTRIDGSRRESRPKAAPGLRTEVRLKMPEMIEIDWPSCMRCMTRCLVSWSSEITEPVTESRTRYLSLVIFLMFFSSGRPFDGFHAAVAELGVSRVTADLG